MSNLSSPLPNLLSLDWGLSWPALVRGQRWIWSLLVIGIVCLDLGLARWQFQRYQLRRAEQQLLSQQVALDTVSLPLGKEGVEIRNDLVYRQAVVTGTFDFENQFVWVGPKDRMDAGPHLVTPLLLTDGTVVLVDRGWLPAGYDTPARWAEFDVQPEEPLEGIVLPGSAVPDPEFLAQQERPVLFWSRMDLPEMEAQLPYALAPYYLHLEPAGRQTALTYPAKTWYTLRTPPSMHAGYVVQWVMSALTVAFLYLLIIRFLDRRKQVKMAEAAAEAQALDP